MRFYFPTLFSLFIVEPQKSINCHVINNAPSFE
nr:MAG TPA: hypothetical protein [Caudoviricetes sp.]